MDKVTIKELKEHFNLPIVKTLGTVNEDRQGKYILVVGNPHRLRWRFRKEILRASNLQDIPNGRVVEFQHIDGNLLDDDIVITDLNLRLEGIMVAMVGGFVLLYLPQSAKLLYVKVPRYEAIKLKTWKFYTFDLDYKGSKCKVGKYKSLAHKKVDFSAILPEVTPLILRTAFNQSIFLTIAKLWDSLDMFERLGGIVAQSCKNQKLNTFRPLLLFLNKNAPTALESVFSSMSPETAERFVEDIVLIQSSKADLTWLIRPLLTNHEIALPEKTKASLSRFVRDIDDQLALNIYTSSNPGKLIERFPKILYNSFSVLTLDIEVRADVIKEIAIVQGANEILLHSIEGDFATEDIAKLADALEGADIVVGHNIRNFDLPEIESKLGITVPAEKVFDTLDVEILIHPTRSSYALDTAHTAIEDCKLNAGLFESQVKILLTHRDHLKIFPILPHALSDFLGSKREEYAVFFAEVSIVQDYDDVFNQAEPNRIAEAIERELTELNLVKDQYVLACPKQYWRHLLYLEASIVFRDEHPELSLVVDLEKVNSGYHENNLHTLYLNRYVTECLLLGRLPYFYRLPIYAQQMLLAEQIECDDVSSVDITQYASTADKLNVTVIELTEDLQQLSQEPDVFIVDASFSDTHRVNLKNIPQANLSEILVDANSWLKLPTGRFRYRLVYQASQVSGPFIETTKSIYSELIAERDNIDYLWLESDGVGSYRIDGSSNLIKQLESKNLALIEINDILGSIDKPKKFYVDFIHDHSLDTTDHVISLNPSTPRRDQYWTILERKYRRSHAETQGSNAKVLFVLRDDELEPVRAFFRNRKWYIPSEEASIRRQLELLHISQSKYKLCLFSLRHLMSVVQWSSKNALTFLFEGFPIEEITHVEEYDFIDGDDAKAKQQNLDGDYYKYFLKFHSTFTEWEFLIGSANKSHQIHISDPRIIDFYEVDKLYGISRISVKSWSSKESFLNKLNQAKNYFRASAQPEELDLSAVFPALEAVFLGQNDLGEIYHFYDEQKTFIKSVWPGDRNIAVTMPTGRGKSVVFEAPALFKGALTGRLTLVVSPLKALMTDHFEKITALGFYSNVDFINQDKGSEIQNIYRRIAGGEIVFLYITPERFKSKGFITALSQRLNTDRRLEYAVFDEAHCISQWGNEFRPDYQRAAAFVRDLQDKHFFPTLLMSATMTEQVFEDLSVHFENIHREKSLFYFNPIREHIDMQFEICDPAQFIDQLLWDLKNRNFNSDLSRVLVFVRSRKKCEEYSHLFNDEPGHTYISSYYHAGMEAESRMNFYEQFKSGDIHVLFSTKAFGMGMDIKNIHFVYHLQPSNNFEDYLQEVGRAGRDPKALDRAGYSIKNPIIAKCYRSPDDFARIQDQLHKNQLSWEQVKSANHILLDYFRRNGISKPDKEFPLPVPTDILANHEQFDPKNAAQEFVLTNYWLWKAGKFTQRYYVPGVFTFDNTIDPIDKIEGHRERSFINLLHKKYNSASEQILVRTEEIYVAIRIKSIGELFKLIFKLHSKGHLTCVGNIRLTEFKLRQDDLYLFNANKDEKILYQIAALKQLFESLVFPIKGHKRRTYSGLKFNRMSAGIFDTSFDPKVFESRFISNKTNTIDIDKKQKFIERHKKDFVERRSKSAIYLINHFKFLSADYHIDLETREVVTIVYKSCSNDVLSTDLNLIISDLRKLVSHLISLMVNDRHTFNLFDLPKEIGLSNNSLEHLQLLFTLCRKLGYFKLSSIIPISIEMFLLDDTPIVDESQEDLQLLQEFQDSIALKKLRLIALNTMSKIAHNKDDVSKFITQYFTCHDAGDIIELIETYHPESQEVMAEFRQQALEEAYEGLNTDQKAIYDFALHENLNVIAGPGSGKTHTLITRVARLMQTVNIPPEQILVLAYNRSVVNELRTRIRSLFARLGFRNYTTSLRIHTFHGFVKNILGVRLKEAEDMFSGPDKFEAWEKYFIHLAKTEPGYITSNLGDIRYVFIDEFQDITERRIKVIDTLSAGKRNPYFTVIGDPIQSIYGYERLKEGGTRSPRKYYDLFNDLYNPKILNLSQNYRSTQEIIDYARSYIGQEFTDFGLPDLTAERLGSVPDSVVSINLLEEKADWLDYVQLFNDGEMGLELALLFRTNAELFRTFAKIKGKQFPHIVLRIQTGKEQFTRIREISHFIDSWAQHADEPMYGSLLDDVIISVNAVIASRPQWDQFTLECLIAILNSYKEIVEENANYSTLIDFIEQISTRDDGTLWKLYTTYYKKDTAKRLILSTMHKSKGLEFESVLITPSFSKLGEPVDKEEYLKEEKCILYVAMTRAQNKLIRYYWKREDAIDHGGSFDTPPNIGCQIEPEVDSLFISSFAKKITQQFLMDTLEIGSEVMIIGAQVKISGVILGRIRGALSTKIKHVFGGANVKGYFITGTFKYYVEEAIAYDQKNGTDFYKKWDEFCITQGYILLPLFAGFGESIK